MKKTSEQLFFFSYIVYLISNILNISFYSIYIHPYMKAIMVGCSLILISIEIIDIFQKKISKYELPLLIVCGVLFSILALHVNGFAMVPLFFFIYSARNVDFSKIIKCTIIVSFAMLIFIIFSASIGIIDNYVDIKPGRTRVYLGFRYALFPQMILYNITSCILYIYRKNFSFLRIAILIFMNYLMFSFTDARLSFYLAVLLVLAVSFLQFKPSIFEKAKKISNILVFIFPICAILSIAVAVSYDSSNATMKKLDDILGGRINMAQKSFDKYPINLLGHKTKYVGNALNMYGKRDIIIHDYVDCLYINMLEKYGIIFSIIFLCLLTYTLYRSLKQKEYFVFTIMVFLALHGMIDDLELNLYYNAFWLVIGKYFHAEKKSLDINTLLIKYFQIKKRKRV